MQKWRRAIVPIEAARCTPASLERARRASELVAWAGGGALEPSRIQELIAPETDAPSSHGLALLVRQANRGAFLITARHLLRTPRRQTDPQLQELIAPDHFWTATFNQAEGATAESTLAMSGQATLKFVAGPLDDSLQMGWLPTTTFPHLDLAAVHIAGQGGNLCSALEEAGYEFVPADLLADGPSREGAKVFAVEIEPSCASGDSAMTLTPGCEGRVISLKDKLSFFWTDIPISRASIGCPIIESDRIVGIVTPQASPIADHTSRELNLLTPFYTVTKAAHVKALLRSHSNAALD
jgi:hypothetical protein